MKVTKAVKFLKLNRNVANDMLGLSVKPEQQHLISSNPEWIIDALMNDDSISYGVYFEGEPIGLVSMIDPRAADPEDNFQEDCLYVWRLMVDKNSQGKGLSIKILEFIKNYAQLVGLRGISLTTMDKEAKNALNLYLNFGFFPTGRRLDKEIELLYELL